MNNRYKKYALLLFSLPFIAWTIAYFTQPFRYTNHRNIYLGGIIATYTCWITAVVWGLINAIELYRENIQLKEKLIFIPISLFAILPILSALIYITFL